MGGCQIATLSVVHRRLFSTTVLLDPAIGPPDHGLHALGLEKLTLRRKTTWASKEAAGVWARKCFRTWDSDVVDLFLKHAIKPVAGDDSSVTLTTGHYQELINYLKPRFIHDNHVKDPEIVYQTGLVDMFHMLELVTCSTLFLCGGKSSLSVPHVRKLWLSKIGEKGYSKLPGEKWRSKVEVLPHVGHFLAMEDPKGCAEALATWINDESSGWEYGSSTQEKMKRQNHAALRRTSEKWMQSLRTKL
ncbi:esterase lipase family [Fusarium phyllophilum]|uniref:Esterase lipase family n=1 Tax=Fusarium phyllophilum TaxID=47803 RepID=A0A8H5NCL5_9HYPO|nr:esterase lipase family [Fusarium phyllophilum]